MVPCIDERHTKEYNVFVIFNWDAEKNLKLKVERGIQFEDIIVAIESGGLIRKIAHPNKEQYAGQELLLVVVEQYVYVVPAVPDEHGYFLKTIYKSRKYTKLFLGHNDEE